MCGLPVFPFIQLSLSLTLWPGQSVRSMDSVGLEFIRQPPSEVRRESNNLSGVCVVCMTLYVCSIIIYGVSLTHIHMCTYTLHTHIHMCTYTHVHGLMEM